MDAAKPKPRQPIQENKAIKEFHPDSQPYPNFNVINSEMPERPQTILGQDLVSGGVKLTAQEKVDYYCYARSNKNSCCK
jgi:hypothetical protein